MIDGFGDMDQLDRMEMLLRKLAREYSVGDCPDCGRKTVVMEVPNGTPTEGVIDYLSEPSTHEIEIGVRCMGCGWFRTFCVVDQERFGLVSDRAIESSLGEQEFVEEVFNPEGCDEDDFYMMKKDNNP